MERKRKPVRFLPLGHSQRTWALDSCLHSEKNKGLFSWKSLFFYPCTDEVLFAPLRSQGVDYRSNYIREKTAAAAPPPCSPKGIYTLADLVRESSNRNLRNYADTSKPSWVLSPSATVPLRTSNIKSLWIMLCATYSCRALSGEFHGFLQL